MTKEFDEEMVAEFDSMPSVVDPFKNLVVGSVNNVAGRKSSELKAIGNNSVSLARYQIDNAEKQRKPKKKPTGKNLESLVKSSAEKQNISIERLKDAGFTGVNTEYGKRFTITNLSDFILFNGRTQCWLEVKSTGTSFSFDFRQRNAMIRKSIKSNESGLRDSEMIGLLIEFKRNSTPFAYWYVDVDDLVWLDENVDKKSFNPKDLEKLYIIIDKLKSYPISTYKPPRARKDYLNIALMMNGNHIDGEYVQLEYKS